jgi:tetratricopeptide (TPR) repeat protein
VEVGVQRALGLARRGECDGARQEAEGLGREREGLAFTRDGLTPFVDGARTQYLWGEVLSRCGDEEGARLHWRKAASVEDSYPQPHVAYAYAAARRLGEDSVAAVRPRVEAALQAWSNRLVVGTNFPGANACGQGLMLRALGREEEARAKLREVFLLPDKLMSHYLSREALALGETPR